MGGPLCPPARVNQVAVDCSGPEGLVLAEQATAKEAALGAIDAAFSCGAHGRDMRDAAGQPSGWIDGQAGSQSLADAAVVLEVSAPPPEEAGY